LKTLLLLAALAAAPLSAHAPEPDLERAVARLASRDPKEREAATEELVAAGAAALEVLARVKKTIGDSPERIELKLAIQRLELRIPVPRVLIEIPAGPFLFGPDRGEERTLPSFLIDRTEVTNAQYKAFLDATAHPRVPDAGQKTDTGWDKARRTYREGMANLPVVGVSLDEAKAYAAWAGLRLPSEEEWEKACRGPDGRPFPWGDEPDAERGRFGADCPARVASHPGDASPFGVLDMAGNVNEWTASRASGGREEFVMKGGSYEVGPGDLRFARADARVAYPPATRFLRTGFRCAKDP